VNLLNELKSAEFQNIISTCRKGFSDVDERIRATSAELLKEIFSIKIKINIEEGASLASKDSKMPSSKKKLLESLPNDLFEVVQYLSDNIYSKITTSNYERK
jgi:hypothetical protein